jgi:hypothetical protein
VAVARQGFRIWSRARVRFVSEKTLVFYFSESGEGLSLVLNRAIRFRSFLPFEALPHDVGGSLRGRFLFLVITLEDGTLCKICELANQEIPALILFGTVDGEKDTWTTEIAEEKQGMIRRCFSGGRLQRDRIAPCSNSRLLKN